MYFSSDLKQGVGRGLSSRPPSKVRVKLHSGWTRHHRRPACRALSLKMCLRPQAKHVEYGCFVFLFVFSPSPLRQYTRSHAKR